MIFEDAPLSHVAFGEAFEPHQFDAGFPSGQTAHGSFRPAVVDDLLDSLHPRFGLHTHLDVGHLGKTSAATTSEIVVIGYPDDPGSGGGAGGTGGGGSGGGRHYDPNMPTDDPGGTVTPPPPPPDADHIEVTIAIHRPLTAAEQKAVDDLLQQIGAVDQAIKSLADNAVLTLPNGQTVTGAELKQYWSMVDFTINEDGTLYANGSTRGEANYNNGNPMISWNIDTLEGYDAWGISGMDFVLLHEIAHLTSANRGFDANTSNTQDSVEMQADDIARAISTSFGLPILSDVNGPDQAGTGYSTADPMTFVTPPAA